MRLSFNLSFAGWIAAVLLATTAEMRTNAEVVAKGPAPRVFTNASEFRALTLPQAIQGLPVRLEGIVTLVDSHRNSLVLQDASGALALELDLAQAHVRVGDRIRVESANAVPSVVGFPDFPAKPSGSDLLPSFSAPTNWGNYYLARMRALLVPPATGDYTFYIASKGASELWLSTNADAAN